MIDFLTLMLINMTAGVITLGFFLIKGLRAENKSNWTAPFAAIGLIALICGFRMVFTWPVIGPYNVIFGEMTVLFGAIYGAIALSLAMKWSLGPLAALIIISSLAALLLGIAIHTRALTASPGLTTVGFIITALGGIFTAWAFLSPASKIRGLAALSLFIAGLIWAFIGYGAYWMHSSAFKDYKPESMRQPPQVEQK